MSFPFKVAAVMAALLVPMAASAKPASQRAAAAAFERLSEKDRFLVPLMLMATGHYDGMSTGAFGPRIFAGLTRFQASIGAAPTGILDAEQQARLFRDGNAFLTPLGLREFVHPKTNAKLYVPENLADEVGQTERGMAFEGPNVSVDFSFFPAEELTLSDLYRRLSTSKPGHDVNYHVLRERFFVVSGTTPQRSFYTRFDIGDHGIVGFTLFWAHSVASGEGGRISVLMANLFTPRALEQ